MRRTYYFTLIRKEKSRTLHTKKISELQIKKKQSANKKRALQTKEICTLQIKNKFLRCKLKNCILQAN